MTILRGPSWLEEVNEFVVQRRLPVNVDGSSEVVENLGERPEPGVVLMSRTSSRSRSVTNCALQVLPVAMAVSAGSPFVIG